MSEASNVSKRPKLELWRAVQYEGSYTHMVWSVDDDQPYWFRSEDAARKYLAARREGDSDRADALARAEA